MALDFIIHTMKILIIGSNGQLGSDLTAVLKQQSNVELITLTHSQIELKDKSSVYNQIVRLNPEVVINCGAYVRVDDCENNAEEAIQINSIGAGFVAEACTEVGAECVYISTDYVFDGLKQSPYTENDLTYPINVYGISKLSGEHMVRSCCSDHYIVRSSGLYGSAGSSGKGGNFVETIIDNAEQGKAFNVVNDQVLTPTFTQDLSVAIIDLINNSEYGTYHITNSGQCSWYVFAQKILEISGIKGDLSPITTEQYGAKAKRPSYSVLSNVKLSDSGRSLLRSWEKALEDYISSRNS